MHASARGQAIGICVPKFRPHPTHRVAYERFTTIHQRHASETPIYHSLTVVQYNTKSEDVKTVIRSLEARPTSICQSRVETTMKK
ncbi:hypothetical protein A0H81_12144 [Grifola frondosa]|uniref:Uncharacterized protein n=1 Tax=Grifola frondosa TaxID=5627 RepID=A0A1C7LTA1_GRIFR|nr:hypothetical protein A0H81_12144 [Grifola frondosa]